MMRATALACGLAMLACSEDARTAPVDAAAPRDGAPDDGRAREGRWLSVASLGVAFSAFPGRQVLTRTLAVRGSDGPALAWTAASDQRWLTVTASGLTGGELVLTASPAGLATDHAYTATVRVASSDPDVRNDQVIRVGLWLGSADPQPVTLATPAAFLVADPVMPYLYASTRASDITVYDIYTGAIVRTFSAVAGRAETLAISSDGALLFVNDIANRRVVAIDTATGAERHRYLWQSLTSSGIAYARPGGHPIIAIGNGKVFDIEKPAYEAFGLLADSEDAAIAFDPDAHFAYALGHGVEPAEVRQFTIAYDPRAATPLIVQGRRSERSGVFGQTLCVAADGSRVYVARNEDSTPAFDPDRLMKIQSLSGGGSHAVCGWNGLVFIGNTSTVSAYRVDGAPAGTVALPAAAGTLVLSGDATRLAGSLALFGGAPSLTFQNAPRP